MKKLSETELIEIKMQAYKEGYEKGYEVGHKAGSHEGLIKDKKGTHLNTNGIYVFEDDETVAVYPEPNKT